MYNENLLLKCLIQSCYSEVYMETGFQRNENSVSTATIDFEEKEIDLQAKVREWKQHDILQVIYSAVCVGRQKNTYGIDVKFMNVGFKLNF